jgi:hypothetical protein
VKAKRQWRLLRRGDDGSATYADDDSELDLSTLTIYPDGSRVTYQASDEGSVTVNYPADPLLPKLINTVGVNLAKAMGLSGDLPVQVHERVMPEPAVPVSNPPPVVEPDAPAQKRTDVAVEPEPAPEPELARHAKRMAKSVWLSGGERRNLLLQGLRPDYQSELLDYAVSQSWITVSDDGMGVSPGAVRPIDVMPEQEPLSARERRLRWGPGEPLDW